MESDQGIAMSHWPGWPLFKPKAAASGGSQRRAYQRKQQLRQEQETVLAILKRKAPELWAGKPVRMDDGQVQSLLAAVCDGAEGHALRIRHNFFVEGLLKGVRAGLWQLPVPPRLQVLRRQPSPFTPRSFAIHHQFRQLYNAFVHSLSVRETDSIDWEAGQLLFAAIACGAMLNQGWLYHFGPALAQGPIHNETHLWLDLRDDQGYLRRWFADPITGLLILRFLRRHGSQYWSEINKQRVILRLIRNYFRSLWGRTKLSILKPDELSPLIEAAKAWWHLRLPPYLVHYAASREMAPSLPPETWIRLYAQRALQSVALPSNLPTGPDPAERKRNRRASGHADVIALYREIRRCFRNPNGKQPRVREVTQRLESFREAHQGQLPFLLQALIEWSLALMRTKRYSTEKLKPRSVSTYLSTIAYPLLANGLDRQPETIDWDDLYEAVLEAASSPKDRARRAARLKSFHALLRHQYGVKAVDLETGNVKDRVDANLITPAEYAVIRARLRHDPHCPNERLRQIRALLLTLGYRLGLRRNEAANLRLRDIQDNQGVGDDLPIQSLRPELLIRSTAHGTVKSSKSVRRLPLALLLSEEELDDLLAFKRQRFLEIDADRLGNELLFANPEDDHRKLPEAETFLPIQQAMREVTGDPSLRFHHLRHSFANFLLLRLVYDEMPQVLPESWWRFDGKDGLPHMDRSLTALLLLNQGKPTPKRLYAVSQLCGHVDPKETLNSYVHLLDWILLHVRNLYLPRLDNAAQAALLDITTAAAKVFRSRPNHKIRLDDLQGLWQARLKRQTRYADPLKQNSLPLQGVTEDGPLDGADPAMPTPSTLQLYRILRMHHRGYSNLDIAERFGFPSQEVTRWIQTAKHLGNLRTTRGRLRFTKDKGKPDLDREPMLPGLCPAPPRRGQDRQDAEAIYRKILALTDSDTPRVEAGLRLFLEHAVSSESQIRFRRLGDQRAWIDFLRRIVSPARLRLTFYPNPQAQKPIKSQRDYWGQELDIPKAQILTHPTETSKRPLGRVDVWVAQKAKPVVLPSSRDADSWPSPGLKFALYMAAVYLGIKVKNGGSTVADPPDETDKAERESADG